jgi:FkbM family methyltransferase
MRTHAQADLCVSRQIQASKIWEPYETSLVINHLKAGDIFLDIGANIGYYTILASAIVKESGIVIACEPDEANFKLLCENLSLNQVDNVIAVQAAVSDYEGSGHLYMSPDNMGDHRLYSSGEKRVKTPIEVIDGRRLKSLSDRVDFIKIDTQGAEYHILRGLEDIVFDNKRHLKMIVEFWPFGLRMSGASGQQLLDVLTSFGMNMSIIDHYSHQLWPAGIDILRSWVNEVDADGANQGFIN